ncbi:MAG: N-acetylmuramoyl-L-alanine amidase [Proteobacteria bacterium]|nr:N-acetylmuramoyl-L-alanine amidase [Pseudomonadota bacterium]
MLVLHYTGMPDCAGALGWLCGPASKVSAHYLIDQDGATYAMVPEERRAWHAGVASWHGEDNINSRSIGIELVNPGHELGYQEFPEAQMAALESLAGGIVRRHDIAAPRVLGHSDVAPTRKQDPGERFDWRRLAAVGVGLWPGSAPEPEPGDDLAAGDEGAGVAVWQSHLAAFGYGVPGHGRYDDATRAVVAAFQRHFRPGHVDGVADAETRGVLTHLLNMFGDS